MQHKVAFYLGPQGLPKYPFRVFQCTKGYNSCVLFISIFILMEYPIHIDTISMELSVLYLGVAGQNFN